MNHEERGATGEEQVRKRERKMLDESDSDLLRFSSETPWSTPRIITGKKEISMTLSGQMNLMDAASEKLSFLSECMSKYAPNVAKDVGKIASLVRRLEEDLDKAHADCEKLRADLHDEKSAKNIMIDNIFSNTKALFDQRDEISKERDFYRDELERVTGFFGKETDRKVFEEPNGLDFLPCRSVALDAVGRSLHKVTKKNWRRSDGMILRSSQCLGTGPVKLLHVPDDEDNE